MKIENRITINAPIEDVWAVFTDLENAAQRMVGINAIELIEHGNAFQVGTRWRETRTLFGKEATEEMWVVASDPPHSYTVEAESRGTHYTTTYSFREVGTGTAVHSIFVGTPQTAATKVFSVVGKLFAGATRKMMQKDLEQLKAACEYTTGLSG